MYRVITDVSPQGLEDRLNRMEKDGWSLVHFYRDTNFAGAPYTVVWRKSAETQVTIEHGGMVVHTTLEGMSEAVEKLQAAAERVAR